MVGVVYGIIGFAVLAILLALRIALAAVLAVITPIVMPILALLSGGGLLVAIGFACAGHWHDALKGFEATLICGFLLCAFATAAQIVNPNAFSHLVSITGTKT